MKQDTKLYIVIGIIMINVCISIPLIISVYGANTISIDNSGRREYGYCPISPETMLSRAEFEINGCPLARVYITNWNQLTLLDQQTIDSQLRSAGFKDIGEFDSRVK